MTVTCALKISTIPQCLFADNSFPYLLCQNLFIANVQFAESKNKKKNNISNLTDTAQNNCWPTCGRIRLVYYLTPICKSHKQQTGISYNKARLQLEKIIPYRAQETLGPQNSYQPSERSFTHKLLITKTNYLSFSFQNPRSIQFQPNYLSYIPNDSRSNLPCLTLF